MALETMDLHEVRSAMEGILFAAGEPVNIDRICLALELDKPTAEQVLQELGDYYAFERRGIRLVRMENCYQLCSAPDYADIIRKAFEIRKPAKLSQPALEVLTIIAYYQPTTRAYVDQVRGVDSSYTMGLLQERKLIEECGRLQVPGRPRLYRTTKEFLRVFHLSSLEELPEMPGLEADGQLRLDTDGAILDPTQLTAAAESEPVKIEDSENIPDAGNETENAEEELAESGGADALKTIVEKIENKVGVYIDYESFIFDYANDYAQRMMEESKQERNVITEPLS